MRNQIDIKKKIAKIWIKLRLQKCRYDLVIQKKISSVCNKIKSNKRQSNKIIKNKAGQGKLDDKGKMEKFKINFLKKNWNKTL